MSRNAATVITSVPIRARGRVRTISMHTNSSMNDAPLPETVVVIRRPDPKPGGAAWTMHSDIIESVEFGNSDPRYPRCREVRSGLARPLRVRTPPGRGTVNVELQEGFFYAVLVDVHEQGARIDTAVYELPCSAYQRMRRQWMFAIPHLEQAEGIYDSIKKYGRRVDVIT